MKIFTYLCALILLLVGISFSLLNATNVNVNYFLGSASLPISFVIIISIAIGAFLSFIFCCIKIFSQKSTIYYLRKKVSLLEKSAANNTKE